MIRGRVVASILLVTPILTWLARDGSTAPFAATTVRAPPPTPTTTPPRVAVVAPGAGDDEIVAEANSRLRLELAAAGLREPDSTQASGYIVAIVRADDQLVAEVRRIDARGPAATSRRFELATTTDPDPATVAAIRTVELLRATILEAARAELPRAPAVAAASPRADGAAPRASDPGRPFQAGFGAVAFQSFGGINTGFGLSGRMAVLLGRSFSATMKVAGAAIGRAQRLPQATVSMDQMTVALGLEYGLGARRRLEPSVSLMGGLYLAELDTQPTGGHAVGVSASSPFASAGAGIAVLTWGDHASLRLEADAVFIARPLHVTLGSTEVGRTGRPLLLVSLRFERAAAFHSTR